MIRLIYTQDPDMRDGFCRVLSLEKKETTDTHTQYQHGEWLLVYSAISLDSMLPRLLELYDPDRLFLPYFGRSVDMMHEIGDIILPNVFLTFDPKVIEVDFDEKNRDAFLGEARFLDIYTEQKDYYVEDFWLSVGGIVVDMVPEKLSEDAYGSLLTAYEADLYVSATLREAYDIVQLDDATTVVTCAVIEWKKPTHLTTDPIDFTLRNMVTAWRLMADDE